MAQTYKRLGAITSSGVIGTADILYTCNVTAAIASTIAICNAASTSATYRICVSTATAFPTGNGTTTGTNYYTGYLAFGGTVNANDTVFLTVGTTLDLTNKYLLVSASAATVAFSVSGVEIN